MKSSEKSPVREVKNDPEPTTSKSIPKPKKSNILIKKNKIKGPTGSNKSAPQFKPAESEKSSENLPIRETPEGDDNNLMPSDKKPIENSPDKVVDSEQDSQSEVSTQGVCTKSIENLKNMPAYGDLTMDISSNAKQPVRKQVDHLYKILVIGDCGSGKTSIIKRYVHKFFTQHYRSTMGVDFALKVLNWDENTLIRLQLWDIAGQERYNNMTRVYYKDAVGAFIVFDVTRVHTFESVATWKADLDSKVLLPNDSPVPCVLLANKCDLQKEGLVNNPGKMEEYCKEKGFIAWFETSAKDNINVDEAAKALIEKILENDTLNNIESNKDDSKFSLEKDSNLQKNGGKKCSC